MLKVAGERLAETLAGVKFAKPSVPYVCNVNATVVTDEKDITELLVRQVSSPVKWEQSVRTMIDCGIQSFVEIGPGKTLAGFMKRIDRGLEVIGINTAQDLEKLG